MRIVESDLMWATDIQSELNEFASQLNGEKTKCDCCSLMKWVDFDQGVLQRALKSAATQVGKLKSLIEDQIKTQSKTMEGVTPLMTNRFVGDNGVDDGNSRPDNVGRRNLSGAGSLNSCQRCRARSMGSRGREPEHERRAAP